MSDIIQLRSFRLIRLVIDQPVMRENRPVRGGRLEIDYDVFRNPEDGKASVMILRIKALANIEKGHLNGPDIEVDALGEFVPPEDLDDQKRELLVRYNGGMILYGMVRGQIAMLTGTFPSNSLLLATLDWKKVVSDVERDKAEAQKAATPAKRVSKTSKKATKAAAPKAATAKKKSATAPKKKPTKN